MPSRLSAATSMSQAWPQSSLKQCSIGTQLSAESNPSLFAAGPSGAACHATSADSHAALLLPESPAEKDSAVRGGDVTNWPESEAPNKGAAQTSVDPKRGPGDDRVLYEDKDIRVFADTLGMQDGSTCASDVLRSTYPQVCHESTSES